MNFSLKKRPLLQIGCSENERYICLVYTQHQQQHYHFLAKPCDEMAFLHDQFTQFRLVRAVPHHYIYRQVTFFPPHYTATQIYRQLIRQLQQELPLPLEAVYFDYHHSRHKEGQRLALLAIRQDYAHALCLKHRPTVLDCELHCLLRGYEQAVDFQEDFATALHHRCFQFGEQFLQFSLNGITLSKTPQADCQCWDLSRCQLPDALTDATLFLIALGASQWNGTA
ncbi:hypothetical protein A4G19_02680 [Pasteurellaceae bacterium Macca]|nr:hypothetical protein [Pasteurellaceae bacterium Macca]